MGDDESIRILVVDDEPFVAQAVGRLLTPPRFRVSKCSDWRLIGSALLESRPHLILLDVNMPELPGGDLCALLRERAQAFLGDTKIVFFSSESVADLERLVRESGADGYIHKTSKTADFTAQVLKHLGIDDADAWQSGGDAGEA